MAKVNFKRIQNVNDLNNLDIVDGNLIVTGDGNLFTDYNNQRIALGGTPDTEMSDTSTSPVQNKIIKKYIDDNISENVQDIKNYIDEKHIYSTSETVVGKWNDKTLYRKVITGNLGQTSIQHGISNAVFKLPYGSYKSGENVFPIPNTRVAFPAYTIGCYVTPTEVVFDKGNGLGQSNTFEIVLEYTKTTD